MTTTPTGRRFRSAPPCDLCTREMVVTFDGALSVSRAADEPLSRSDDVTVRIRLGKLG